MTRQLILTCLIAIVAGLGANTVVRADDEEPVTTGTYECTGTNPGDQTYTGVTKITKDRDVYRVTWNIGNEWHTGTGIRSNNTLSVIWQTGDVVGVVVYSITQSGGRVVLTGEWTVHPGTGEVWDETLVRSQ